jgi:hypothetical protein
MSLIKLAETIEMSIEIPDGEINIAKRAVVHFEKLVKKLNSFNKHLNAIYNPFKEYQTVSSDSVEKYRGAIWKYRSQIKENFDKIKELSLLCVRDMSHFDSDTHITELLTSFSNDVGGTEDQVSSLMSVLSNWDTGNYKNNVVTAIESLKKEIAELRKLIYDRIIDHLNTNILAKNWVDDISDELNISIQDREPVITQLYQEREKQLKQMLSKEKS